MLSRGWVNGCEGISIRQSWAWDYRVVLDTRAFVTGEHRVGLNQEGKALLPNPIQVCRNRLERSTNAGKQKRFMVCDVES
eukprot:762815-Hanusia_phi.AAC.4